MTDYGDSKISQNCVAKPKQGDRSTGQNLKNYEAESPLQRSEQQKFELQLKRDMQSIKLNISDKLELNSNLNRVWTAGTVDTAGMNFVLNETPLKQRTLVSFLPEVKREE